MKSTFSSRTIPRAAHEPPAKSHRGWTLLELMWVVMIIGTLAALATVSYQHYINKARAADLLLRYDAIRAGVSIAALNNEARCDALQQGFDRSNLISTYANLRYGWQSVPGGYRPVLNVCATADRPNIRGVRVAQEAYREFDRLGVVRGSPVLTPTVVSYALALGEHGGPVCTQAQPVTVARACDEPVSSGPPVQVTPPPTVVVPPVHVANPTTVLDPPVQAVNITPDVPQAPSTQAGQPAQAPLQGSQPPVQATQAPQPPGSTFQGGAGPGHSSCQQSCRSLCPPQHVCNSIAYRRCMANCP